MMHLKHFINQTKDLFFSGLIFLLPIAISISIIKFFFNIIVSFLNPLKAISIPYISLIPHYEILLLIILIFLVGSALKILFLRPFLKWIESCFAKIPLFSAIYSSIKQLTKAFSAQNANSKLNTVVIIEFPLKGMHSFGFIVSDQIAHEISPASDKKYVNVYVPTTPNPAHGFFIMIPEASYIQTDLTHQEATALIISGGIVQPQRYKKESC